MESFGESLLKSRFSFLKLLGNIRWLCPHWTNLVRLIQSGVTHNADVLVRSIGRSLILLDRRRLDHARPFDTTPPTSVPARGFEPKGLVSAVDGPTRGSLARHSTGFEFPQPCLTTARAPVEHCLQRHRCYGWKLGTNDYREQSEGRLENKLYHGAIIATGLSAIGTACTSRFGRRNLR